MITQKYKEIDGIKIFHDDIDENLIDYNPKFLDKLYEQEERHFWFISRKEFIFQQMEKNVNFSSRTIEIGAGTGNVSRYLKNNGYSNISVGEMYIHGLRYAKSYGIEESYQFDILRTPFKDEFDAICMFDVLEHLDDDNMALISVHQMLKNNGKFILTVPAHNWLWSRIDKISGHKRRYTKKEIILKLKNAGFDLITERYFFMSIVPLLFLRRIFNNDNDATIEPEEYIVDISINPILSKILLFVSRLENKVNKVLPNFFGGSLLVIGCKR